MKKVIDLFDSNYLREEGLNYTQLLEKFMTKFQNELEEFRHEEEWIDFSIGCWNYRNLSTKIPKEEFKKFVGMIPKPFQHLSKKMIAHKTAQFKQYTDFIVDFKLEETEEGSLLILDTQEEEDYFNEMMDAAEGEWDESNFEENYINRSAIVLKPQQPFLDWYYKLYPEDMGMDYIKETNIYLVSEEIDDLEQWLKKKFDRFFKLQLEDYHYNKKQWPQRRTYKMFAEWFQVDIAPDIYDTEKRPVLKFK